MFIFGNLLLTEHRVFVHEAVAPNSVDLDDEFTVTLPTITETLDTGPGNSVASYSNHETRYAVTGGTIVPGSATAGPHVNNGTPVPTGVTIVGNELRVAWAGPAFPGTIDTPVTTFRVTPAAAGTQVRVLAAQTHLNVLLTQGQVLDVTCPLHDTVLSTTHVGLDAIDDQGSTQPATATTIDVLANDVPSPTLAIDAQTLQVVTPPDDGTAAVTADHKILYTPDPLFSGTDAFTYEVSRAGGRSMRHGNRRGHGAPAGGQRRRRHHHRRAAPDAHDVRGDARGSLGKNDHCALRDGADERRVRPQLRRRARGGACRLPNEKGHRPVQAWADGRDGRRRGPGAQALPTLEGLRLQTLGSQEHAARSRHRVRPALERPLSRSIAEPFESRVGCAHGDA